MLLMVAVFASGRASHLVQSRIALGAEPRLETWRQALRDAARAPVFGTGPGSLRIVYVDRGQPVATGFAHDEFLQTLAETGVVGLIGVLIAVGLFVVMCARSRPDGRERLVWAASVACCAAFVAQSLFDLMWRFPILVSVAFLWLAMATFQTQPERGRDST